VSLPITSIRAPVPIPLPALSSTAGTTAPSSTGFSSELADAIGRVDQFQQNAQSSIGKFLGGEDEEVHKVALATQQAAMSFDLFLQMRNKVVSAYQEVMRMQM
jgi:flagellar hook-basal body complex protein FliE